MFSIEELEPVHSNNENYKKITVLTLNYNYISIYTNRRMRSVLFIVSVHCNYIRLPLLHAQIGSFLIGCVVHQLENFVLKVIPTIFSSVVFVIIQ